MKKWSPVGKSLVVVLVGAVLVVSLAGQQRTASLTGAWRVTELTTTGPNGTTNSNLQPRLVLFTATHYARVGVTSPKPRPVPEPGEFVTDPLILQQWGPFAADAGTYQVSGTDVTLKAIVAKNPAAMSADGRFFVTYTFRIDGNTLTLTQKGNQNGPLAPVVMKLTRAEATS
jgi:hypothetical protein